MPRAVNWLGRCVRLWLRWQPDGFRLVSGPADDLAAGALVFGALLL